jgi:hypothetical protein
MTRPSRRPLRDVPSRYALTHCISARHVGVRVAGLRALAAIRPSVALVLRGRVFFMRKLAVSSLRCTIHDPKPLSVSTNLGGSVALAPPKNWGSPEQFRAKSARLRIPRQRTTRVLDPRSALVIRNSDTDRVRERIVPFESDGRVRCQPV